ncbi:hypothetical protein TD95_004268 [Thielaviopsis punctulata]|uniref:Uncharacterized protein n=1 Tax=Thielaviopsis punctulata TaxID=72032 RepID=A0A0F4ZCL3_9PEZI|nr:hypothetical protein TD95_004268 [Thielaviopsis punctulata]
MLDENLPTFRGRQSTENPLNTLFSFTQAGSDPTPEFLLRRPDPTQPESKNKYAIALSDPILHDVIYAEVLVEPEWRQNAATDGASGGTSEPSPPDAINIQLYNPDQTVVLRQVPGSWGRGGSWDFELPTTSFKKPTASQIDRESEPGPAARDLVPRLTFRWKRERLSRSLTCYLVGKSADLDGKKSHKEPDITVALAEHGKHGVSAMAVYEPNMRRVEIEDRRGLEMVLLMSSEIIRDLFISSKDPYNLDGHGRRKSKTARSGASASNSPTKKPAASSSSSSTATTTAATSTGATMSGAAMAMHSSPPRRKPVPGSGSDSVSPSPQRLREKQSAAEIDAETARLKAMVEREERERREIEALERQQREEAERLRREREAEVARETERLRKLYGTDGQDFTLPPPSPLMHASAAERPGAGAGAGASAARIAPPALPPRPGTTGPHQKPSQYQQYFEQHTQQPFEEPAAPSASHSSRLATKFEQHMPLTNQAVSTVSGLLSKMKKEMDDKKVHKKRSM